MINIRSATIKDIALLLEWRNDPQTRISSHKTNEIKEEEHRAWLIKTLNNPNRKLYIAEENKIPIGTVRADYFEGIYELSWTVAPSFRNQGIGKKMVAFLANQIKEPIRAEIKKDNIASICIAKHAGMKYYRQDNGILHYKREALGIR